MLDLIQLTSKQLSKASLNDWSEDMIKLIEGGDINPLEAHAKAKAIRTALDTVLKSTEDLAQDEAMKYGAKTFEAFGAKVTLKDGATTPTYEEDSVWAELKEQLKAREELIKLAFKAKDVEIIDTITGEVVKKVSPKYSKSSISIQF
jgi:cell fate (sporulation/competence/biofilm development) regulator YlbF (YheA/YmcA/DUF963 family)